MARSIAPKDTAPRATYETTEPVRVRDELEPNQVLAALSSVES